VSKAGAWEEWVEYFLNGVARQSEDALSRASRINALADKWREGLAGGSSRVPVTLIDLLLENPYWTITGAARTMGVAYTTARRAFDRLETNGVLEQVGEAKRDRVFCATEVLSILEEPARLTPTEGETDRR